ncbi:MAG TPA: STAS domain-containing protein, partial [Ramlibacter sp.]|nr:STAS domain-containing protein [Ramlibacter sp.]
MEGTSWFAQVAGAGRAGWRTSWVGSLEAAATAIPLSLGCATLVFSRIGPEAMASGLFATMLALACVHLAAARNDRPVMFTARIFEATTLAAMLDHIFVQLPTWELADTPGIRLAFLSAVATSAGLFVCLLYLLRAERLTPFIPAPVFAGFSNSIAVVQLVSQSRSLWHQVLQAPGVMVVASIAAVSLVGAYVLRRWRPRWPSAALGLVLGLLAGVFWAWQGQPAPMVSGGGLSFGLPALRADFGALLVAEVRIWPAVLLVLGNGAILGTMIFINTEIGAQEMTQVDGKRRRGRRDGLVTGAAMAAAGMVGAAPISGSIMVSLAVARTSRVGPLTMVMMAVLAMVVFLTGVLGWVPLAAVVGVLLCDAWFLLDRPSLRLLAQWLRGVKLADNQREDLALVAAVTLLAVAANMVVAAFAGLVLGLFLFAVRSARQPVRHVWTGEQVSSNCARASAELRVLARHGREIRVFELEGDMFFAVAASLEESLHAGCEGATCVVLDWSRVRHIDTSVATTVSVFERTAAERGVAVFHAGAGMQHGNVADELHRRMPHARLAPDLDYALELAENRLVQWHGTEAGREPSAIFDAVLLFSGLTP